MFKGEHRREERRLQRAFITTIGGETLDLYPVQTSPLSSIAREKVIPTDLVFFTPG